MSSISCASVQKGERCYMRKKSAVGGVLIILGAALLFLILMPVKVLALIVAIVLIVLGIISLVNC